MTSVFNTHASLPYNHDLFESLIVKKMGMETALSSANDGPAYVTHVPTNALLVLDTFFNGNRRTIRVLNQSLWLKSLTARQRCLAGNANALPFLRNKSPHVPTPNLEGQETVFVRPLTIDQPGVRDSSRERVGRVITIDPRTPSVPETDPSDVAISATRNQDDKPVAFFSRTLPVSGKPHSAIQKEACAIVEEYANGGITYSGPISRL
ncbi:hypothetical protein T265_04432 [Opisthorchis viverrini]|uniref:Uncharacterized protein n=1 Tax=Opisthorchis viverrini TaxID=6198 RepID=A0A074ZNY8_OPIVI|nr:hypothetical protein T265_04432 [Opisthorchis viverrini]KER28826.1 hypothetical protein T265_04432 [Opisthorchis viverrini]